MKEKINNIYEYLCKAETTDQVEIAMFRLSMLRPNFKHEWDLYHLVENMIIPKYRLLQLKKFC